MANLTAPLLSFEASGSISGEVQYARLRGTNYAKRIVSGIDKNSNAQQLTRGVFKFSSDVWKQLPDTIQEQWEFYAKQKNADARNLFIGNGVASLRGKSTLADWPIMVQTQGMTKAVNLQIGVFPFSVFFQPVPVTLPPGWVPVRRHLATILQQDPYNPTDLEIKHSIGPGLDPGPIVGNLTVGLTYYCWAWWELENRDSYPGFSSTFASDELIP